MSAKSQNLSEIVTELADQLVRRNAMLCCAESCTGGLIAAACTEQAGSSAWFDRGFVTYSNLAKQQMLGVPEQVLETAGAVSGETVWEMTRGALANSAAQYAVAVSGIAGPGGGSTEKPVGTVWIAWEGPEFAATECYQFEGDRAAVREATVGEALAGLLKWLAEESR